jgi:hypothetical protein
MRVLLVMADQLARTGSEQPFGGPEPACGISIGVAKKAVRDWTNRNRNHKKTLGIRYWTQTSKGTYTARRTKDMLKLNRDQL